MATTIISHVPAAMVASYTNMYLSEGATSVTPIPTGPGEVMLVIVFPDPATMHAVLGPSDEAASADG